MTYRQLVGTLGLLLGLLWLTSACASVTEEAAANIPEPTPTTASTEANLPIEIAIQGTVRQWAIMAEASTFYADPEWAAEQATGEPDTPRCGDIQTAWASSGSDSVDWLELQFETPVFVTGINIVQTFNANQVSKVELVGDFGRSLTIYEQIPAQVDQPCPYIMSIAVDKTRATYSTVRITVDQSILGLGWNEIDAVQLVGDRE